MITLKRNGSETDGVAYPRMITPLVLHTPMPKNGLDNKLEWYEGFRTCGNFNVFFEAYMAVNPGSDATPDDLMPLWDNRPQLSTHQFAAMMTEVAALPQEASMFSHGFHMAAKGPMFHTNETIPAQVCLYLSGNNGLRRILYWRRLLQQLEMKHQMWRLEDLDFAHRDNSGKPPPRITLLNEMFSIDMETSLDYGATLNPSQGPTWLRRLYHRYMSTSRFRPLVFGVVNFNLANANWPEFLNPYDPTTYLGDLARMPSFTYVTDDELTGPKT
jgi:hypothetical protein